LIISSVNRKTRRPADRPAVFGYSGPMDPFLRHIQACKNATLPGDRRAFRLGACQGPVGWMRPAAASVARAFPGVAATSDGVTLADPGALQSLARALVAGGHGRWRGEAFDVRADPDGPALARVDRGLLPVLGIQAQGVHVNGLVRRADGWHLWVAVRAADKLLDPNKLDHIVAGGIPAGLTAMQTLVKEAAEEAAIPPELAARAVFAGRLGYAMDRPEGLRRDLLHCYDLELPDDFVPHPTDGEVSRFELWPITHALEMVRGGDSFKFNVNLVLIDLFLRLGLIVGEQATVLRAALAAG
jgi:8-oxo-dGTP pyrophosphatase MutT (NUDIX family)